MAGNLENRAGCNEHNLSVALLSVFFFFFVKEFCEDRIFIYVVRLANLLGRCVLAQHVIGFLCYHI